MSREDVEKLLGGYATGNLTPEQREELFAAALDDQQLFDRLAREEALRELLEDPVTKARLLAALDVPKVPWFKRWMPAALAGALAGLILTVVVLERQPRERRVFQIAEMKVPPVPQAMPIPDRLEFPEVPPVRLPARRIEREAKAAEPEAPADAAAPAAPAPQASAQALTAGSVAAPAAPAAARARQNLIKETAGARSNGPQNARDLFSAGIAAPFPAADGRLSPAELRAKAADPSRGGSYLGLYYRLLTQTGDTFSEVNPQRLAGSMPPVRIEVVTNAPGYVYLFERDRGGEWRLLENQQVSIGNPQYLPRAGVTPPESGGTKEFFVLFSRQARNVDGYVPYAGTDQTVTTNTPERATYVVSTNPDTASQEVSFPITLTYR